MDVQSLFTHLIEGTVTTKVILKSIRGGQDRREQAVPRTNLICSR
jgi:hypothetical protein